MIAYFVLLLVTSGGINWNRSSVPATRRAGLVSINPTQPWKGPQMEKRYSGLRQMRLISDYSRRFSVIIRMKTTNIPFPFPPSNPSDLLGLTNHLIFLPLSHGSIQHPGPIRVLNESNWVCRLEGWKRQVLIPPRKYPFWAPFATTDCRAPSLTRCPWDTTGATQLLRELMAAKNIINLIWLYDTFFSGVIEARRCISLRIVCGW